MRLEPRSHGPRRRRRLSGTFLGLVAGITFASCTSDRSGDSSGGPSASNEGDTTTEPTGSLGSPSSTSTSSDIATEAATEGSSETTDLESVNEPAATVSSASLERLRFAVIGDYGVDCCAQGDVAELVDRWEPQFIVTTGDNRYDEVEPDDAIGKYFSRYIGDYSGSYGEGAEINSFFPAAGNHDYTASGGFDAYLDYFDLPGDGIPTSGTSGNERYYDFIRGPIHFFILNSNDGEPDGFTKDSDQAAWLREQLAASQSPWQVVVVHHPPFSSGTHGPYEPLRWPFAEWGADLVMSGDEHSYERIVKDDLTYVINGAGGRRLRGYGFDRDPDSAVFVEGDHGALLVEGCAATLTFEFHTIDDEVADSFTLGEGSC